MQKHILGSGTRQQKTHAFDRKTHALKTLIMRLKRFLHVQTCPLVLDGKKDACV